MSERSGAPVRVLHVDDEPAVADPSGALEAVDGRLDVERVTSAGEAVERLVDGRFDCVVSAVDPSTGIELLDRVRDDHPDLPFVLFVADGNETVASRAISAGVTDYLRRQGENPYARLADSVVEAVGADSEDGSGPPSGSDAGEHGAGIDWERAVLGSVGGWIYVLDADYTFRFVDHRVGELDALSEDLAGRELSHLESIGVLAPEEVARIEDGIDRVLDGETDAADVEIEPAVPEGTDVAEVRLTPLTPSDGESVVLATTHDVSERRHRERKLERYETIVEAIDDAAFVVDEDWTVAYANQSATDNVRASPDGVNGQPVVSLVEEYAADEDGPGRFAGALERSFGADDPAAFSERLELALDVGDDERVFAYQFSPIVEDGSVEAVAVTSRDVTERRERERKLEALHDATRDLAGAESHGAIAETAVETARDVLDLPISGLYLHDEEANVLEPVAITDEAVDLFDEIPTFEPGESISWEVFRSGEMRQFDDVSTVPGRYNPDTTIRSELVVPVGEYGVMNIGSTESDAFGETDLSLARILAANAEAAMARADRERELARQNERLGEFASIVSHDLRNPLQVAEGRLDLIREDHDDDHLDALERALDRMERLIDDLLDLAREGEAVEELEAVDLAALAERCWRTVETADATLVVETDRTVRADSGRLQQLLENLLGNAVEHGSTSPDSGARQDASEHGSTSPDPETRRDAGRTSSSEPPVADAPGDTVGDGGSVTIEIGDLDRGFYVVDDGPGIPEGERDAVFEAGYSTSEDGTGFGLSIVKEIADAHGWNLRVTDGESGGARFEITGVDAGD